MSTDKTTPRIADDMQSITDRTEAKVWLASINAPETEDRVLWAQFLATNPSVTQVHLASKLALEERERAVNDFDQVVAALERFMPICSKCDEIATWVSTMSGVRLCATHKTAACREDEDLSAASKALAAVKTDSGDETKG